MKIYFAGNGSRYWEKKNFYDFYRLDSFLYMKKNENHKKYRDFMLDSGIFSYISKERSDINSIDWDDYVDRYADFVKKKNIEKYVEVDVDKIVGLKEVERLRVRLEKRVGWKSMPVWHINRSYDKWLEICKDYNYICFGAFLTDNLSKSKYKVIDKFLMDAYKHNTKVHGLGMTSINGLKKMSFYSVDSSSWLSGTRFGHICKYCDGQIKNIRLPKNQSKEKYKKLTAHNFEQWLMFANYAEKYL